MTGFGSEKKVPSIDIEELIDTISSDGSRLVVMNDNHNTFEWVIESFVEVLNHNFYQAEQCAHLIHSKGKCSVREGDRDELLPLKDSLSQRGLRVIIE